MNSRERIYAAVRHQPVDRLAIDFGGTRQSGISAFAYDRLRRRLALPGHDVERPFRVFDTYQMLAEVEQRIADRFGNDCIALNRKRVAFGVANERWKSWRPRPDVEEAFEVLVPGGFEPVRSESGGWVLKRDGEVIAEMPAGGFYFDRYEPYPGATHPDLDTWEAPRLSAADIDHYGRTAETLFEQTDKAIVMPLGPPYELFNGIGQGGFERWMMTFASEPDYVDALYTKLVDAWIENLKAVHDAVGERVQVLQIADDFGMQSGPFLSEAMFRERLLPAYRRGLAWVHQHTTWRVLLHSDGAIRPLIPAIIEMGVDILNPVQTSAPGMEPKGLKRDFGDRLAFWGGACDPQSTLSRGTPERVASEVAANVNTLAPGSGYVFAPVHNIQADVPADNIVALFDTALRRAAAHASPRTAPS